jgi:hypothetical protein
MESPRQPGELKTCSPVAEGSAGAPAVAEAKRYPTPPALWKRLVLLCLHPESWALAARYPTRFTLVALAVAIVIGAASAGIGDGIRCAMNIQTIAANYDAIYPTAPLEITAEGLLKATPAFREPILFSLPTVRLLVDPTCKTTPESIKTQTFLVTDRDMVFCGVPNMTEMRFPLFFGDTGAVTGAWIREAASSVAWELGILTFMALTLGNALWAAVMMFLICPLIMLVAGTGVERLMLPKRAAYRMAAAFLVPLVVFSGLMHGAGYWIMQMFGGPDSGLLFWCGPVVVMAVWTALMARKIYGPIVKRRAN